MRYMEGHGRTPWLLLPDVLDDDVTAENPVCCIDAYAESLDLASLGFARAQAALTGRPADDPRELRKLYIYGYRNRIRASRRLERETHRNVALIWRLRKLRPDFKTIADFRNNNTEARQALCRAFVLLCRQLDLFGAELLALDGSKFKAVNNQHKNFTQAKLEQALKDIDATGEQSLRDLEACDREESSVHHPIRALLQAKIERLQERQK